MCDCTAALETYEGKMKRYICQYVEGKPPNAIPREDTDAFMSCLNDGYILGVDLLPQENGDIIPYTTHKTCVTEKGRNFVR